LTHPNPFQSRKLIPIADHKDFLAGYNPCKETLACGEFTTKLLSSIDGWVHFSGKFLLRRRRRVDHPVQRKTISHHHQINVAIGLLSPPGHRPVDERQPDFARKTGQRIAQNLRHPKRLPDQSAQFLEHRTAAVRLKISLPPLSGARQNSTGGEPLQFSLHSAGPQSESANDLPLIESLAGLSEEKLQNALPRRSK
jgi:hypothetical protein